MVSECRYNHSAVGLRGHRYHGRGPTCGGIGGVPTSVHGRHKDRTGTMNTSNSEALIGPRQGGGRRAVAAHALFC
jgi:hypothetical protein